MPPLVLTVIGIINLVIKSAPEIKKVYDSFHSFVNMLFSGGIITVDQQKALMDWANTHQAAVLAGKVPPEFMVESNPK